MKTQRIDQENWHLHQGGFVNFGGFYIRPMGPYQKGERQFGHSHAIDHLSNIVRGKVRVHWKNPKGDEAGVIEVLVPAKLSIRAEYWHEFEVLEDDTYWECWFAAAEADKLVGGRNSVDWTA
jgi:hypothetical protein